MAFFNPSFINEPSWAKPSIYEVVLVYLSGMKNNPKNCITAGTADKPKDHLQAFCDSSHTLSSDVVFVRVVLSVSTSSKKTQNVTDTYHPSHKIHNSTKN